MPNLSDLLDDLFKQLQEKAAFGQQAQAAATAQGQGPLTDKQIEQLYQAQNQTQQQGKAQNQQQQLAGQNQKGFSAGLLGNVLKDHQAVRPGVRPSSSRYSPSGRHRVKVRLVIRRLANFFKTT